MTYTLVETCCGSAALTLHLLGARRSVLPYQGSKWRFRRNLEARVRRLGFEGPPSRVVLTDPGPWGKAIGAVLDRELRAEVVRILEDLNALDAESVYSTLHHSPVATEPARFAAQFLFLQRLAFSGKAVGIDELHRWKSPGLNRTSAYGKPATEKFGAINPMIPSLIRVLRSYDDLADVEVVARQERAVAPDSIDGPTLVYIDPPYWCTTGYPNGEMKRQDVLCLALDWRKAGAAVMVSEGHPLRLDGWTKEQLCGGSSKGAPFRGKQREWVTFARPLPRELEAEGCTDAPLTLEMVQSAFDRLNRQALWEAS